MAHFAGKRYEGTYMQVPKLDWETLLEVNFGNPDWLALYPIAKNGQPSGMLSPRLACKIFYDMIYILQKTEENPKFLQDRLPECTHKFYKKKQWRKQMIEGGKRLACRVGKGKGLSPNCIAEDAFIHVTMGELFGLGWRRINQFIEPLPETEKDKDFARVSRLAALDEIGYLYRLDENGKGKESAPTSKPTTKEAAAKNPIAAKSKASIHDIKSWFCAYELDLSHMTDHVIAVN